MAIPKDKFNLSIFLMPFASGVLGLWLIQWRDVVPRLEKESNALRGDFMILWTGVNFFQHIPLLRGKRYILWATPGVDLSSAITSFLPV